MPYFPQGRLGRAVFIKFRILHFLAGVGSSYFWSWEERRWLPFWQFMLGFMTGAEIWECVEVFLAKHFQWARSLPSWTAIYAIDADIVKLQKEKWPECIEGQRALAAKWLDVVVRLREYYGESVDESGEKGGGLIGKADAEELWTTQTVEWQTAMLRLGKERVELASEKKPDTAEACAALLDRAYDIRMRTIELDLQSSH
ncbi:hypothetical protein Slin14017_G103830 [Septoria linicola]|nr:hypothetical protein Slin14017_G103830 [Septoria linicola]